jgi:putative Mg2+ transporter-C (MgtC) family protein
MSTAEVAVRLVLAAVLGCFAGLERQWQHKSAGLRTHTLVALGAAGFTIVSMLGLGPTNNPMLIAGAVVSGIGFVGGGVIMHRGETVQGINTAATLWATASIGLSAGAGYYALTGMIFALVLFVQFPIRWLEEWLERESH